MESKVSELTTWLKSKSVSWDEGLIELTDADSRVSSGLGFSAVSKINEGSCLSTIPKSAFLSIKNTDISDVLESRRLGGGLALTFAVMYERARGEDSPWFGYLKSLPPRVFLPAFWQPEILQLVQGTSISLDNLKADADAMAQDFKEVENAIIMNKTRFEEMSMVPLADIFNHKAAVVLEKEGYEIAEIDDMQKSRARKVNKSSKSQARAGDPNEPSKLDLKRGVEALLDDKPSQDGDNLEGSNSKCARTQDGSEEGTKLEKNEGIKQETNITVQNENVPDNGLAVCNQAPLVSGSESDRFQLQISIIDREGPSEDQDNEEEKDRDADGAVRKQSLQIVAASTIEEGQEVHNTYGEYSNLGLVWKYGFALQANPFNQMNVSVCELESAAKHVIGEEAVKARIDCIKKMIACTNEEASDEEEEGEDGVDTGGCCEVDGDPAECGGPHSHTADCCGSCREGEACEGKRGTKEHVSDGGPQSHTADCCGSCREGEACEGKRGKDADQGCCEVDGDGGCGEMEANEEEEDDDEDDAEEDNIDLSSLHLYENGSVSLALLSLILYLGGDSNEEVDSENMKGWVEKALAEMGLDQPSIGQIIKSEEDKVPVSTVRGKLSKAQISLFQKVLQERQSMLQKSSCRLQTVLRAVQSKQLSDSSVTGDEVSVLQGLLSLVSSGQCSRDELAQAVTCLQRLVESEQTCVCHTLEQLQC